MNTLTKMTLGFACFLQTFSVTAASINKLLFDDQWQNISRKVTRQWEFDKASWEMSIEIRDTVKISSFSKLKAMEAVKIITPNEPAVEQVEFAAVIFTAVREKQASGAGLENSRNEKRVTTDNLLENIGAETTEQFTQKGLSLDLFFPKLKMGNSEPL